MPEKQLPAPLLIPALAWCLGIGLARNLGWPGWAPWLAACLLLTAALLFSRARIYLLLALCLVLGALRWQVSERPTQLDLVLNERGHIQQEARFEVRKLLSRQGFLHEIRIRELAGLRLREPVLLYSDTGLDLGSEYRALLEILPGKQDPVLDTWPARHRAYVRQGLQKLHSRRRLLPVAQWRSRLLAALDTKLGSRADFAKALLLGDIGAKGLYRDQLVRGGMQHLIVVSGLHIWFLYGVCLVLFGALLSRRGAELAFILLTTLYAALNHWSPPVLRALLMIGLLVLGRWRSIPLGGPQLLAVSLVAITLANPAQLFDAGLQLSFICVGVILLAVPRRVWISERRVPSERLRKPLNRAVDLLLINLAVSVAILPVTLYHFGTASFNGIVGNLLGIPLIGALLLVSFLVLLLPGGNFVSAAYIASYRVLLDLFEAWSVWVARLPFYLDNRWLSGWQLVGGALLALCGLHLLRQLRWYRRILPAAALGLALLIVPAWLKRDAGGIHVFACGTADCILARFPDGDQLLIDSGPMYYNATQSWAQRKLLPWVKRKQMGDLDWMVLTHLDVDHSGGFEDIARAWKPRHLIVSDEITRDARWRQWQDAGLLTGITVHSVRDTVSFQLRSARLKFLHPAADFLAASSNAGSLVFRLDHVGTSFLFTGDADIEAEEHMLSRFPEELKADYLKAGHHGSRSSSSPAFVRAVLPREVWITAAPRNRWDFPHPEPLAAFRQYDARIRGTAGGSIYHSFAKKD